MSLDTANVISSLAWMIAIVGVVLTGASVVALFVTSAVRDKNSDLRIKTAETNASEAAREIAQIKHANLEQTVSMERERAERLRLEAELQARIDATEVNAAEAARKIEQIEHADLELAGSLERERAERLRLEAKLRPRKLTDEQRRLLIAALKTNPPLRKVVIIWLGGDESEKYARDIARAFTAAGVSATVGTNFAITSVHGLNVIQDAAGYSRILVEVFIKAGIAAHAHAPLDGAKGAYIVVGYKDPSDPVTETR